jgi:hypothetical protein
MKVAGRHSNRTVDEGKIDLNVIKGKSSPKKSEGQSNSPNNSDKMKLKQLQCCQLGELQYIFSEIINC